MKGQHKRKMLQFFTNIEVDWTRFHRRDEPQLGAFGIVAAKGDWRHWWESFRFGELWNHAFIYCGDGLIVESWQHKVRRAPVQVWIDADILWSDHQGNIGLAPEVGRKIADRALTFASMRSPLSPAELVAECWESSGAPAVEVGRANHVRDLKAVIEFWSPDDTEEADDA